MKKIIDGITKAVNSFQNFLEFRLMYFISLFPPFSLLSFLASFLSRFLHLLLSFPSLFSSNCPVLLLLVLSDLLPLLSSLLYYPLLFFSFPSYLLLPLLLLIYLLITQLNLLFFLLFQHSHIFLRIHTVRTVFAESYKKKN